MKKAAKTSVIAAGICAGVTALGIAFRKSFQSMKESAKEQHQVDKAEFAQVKAESKAFFEENRGRNTFARAKADAKKSWNDAKRSPSQRAADESRARQARIAEAKAQTAEAEARCRAAKH